MALEPGQIISYHEMCLEEDTSLQKGMNFRLRGNRTIILMSVRPNAPYRDQVMDKGRVLIYEGHDVARTKGVHDPKSIDQPMTLPSGRLTQNGLFYKAAQDYKSGHGQPETVRVYEKVRDGIWTFNGIFLLTDAWQESDGVRTVFKFKLELAQSEGTTQSNETMNLSHTRFIPSSVKREVWERDKGKCVICGSTNNLHFDHEIPFSRGGSSLTAANIRLLCMRHNLSKSDHIE